MDASVAPTKGIQTPLIIPIPPHPHGRPVCGEKIVAGPRKLAIDVKPAPSALVDLVLDTKIGLPGTTVGAGLGSARLERLDNMASSVARRRGSKALHEERMAPREHGT